MSTAPFFVEVDHTGDVLWLRNDDDSPGEEVDMDKFQLTVSLRADIIGTDQVEVWAKQFETKLAEALANTELPGEYLETPTFRVEVVAYEDGAKIEHVTSRKIEMPVLA